MEGNNRAARWAVARAAACKSKAMEERLPLEKRKRDENTNQESTDEVAKPCPRSLQHNPAAGPTASPAAIHAASAGVARTAEPAHEGEAAEVEAPEEEEAAEEAAVAVAAERAERQDVTGANARENDAAEVEAESQAKEAMEGLNSAPGSVDDCFGVELRVGDCLMAQD